MRPSTSPIGHIVHHGVVRRQSPHLHSSSSNHDRGTNRHQSMSYMDVIISSASQGKLLSPGKTAGKEERRGL